MRLHKITEDEILFRHSKHEIIQPLNGITIYKEGVTNVAHVEGVTCFAHIEKSNTINS